MDFVIPAKIWDNKNYTINQKIIIGVVWQHRPAPVLLDYIVCATGLNKQIVATNAKNLFLIGPKPIIERCYIPNTETKSFFVAYKYNGGEDEK